MDVTKADRWVRQLTFLAMVLAALALLITGISLYAPRVQARPHEPSSCDNRASESSPTQVNHHET